MTNPLQKSSGLLWMMLQITTFKVQIILQNICFTVLGQNTLIFDFINYVNLF